MARCDLSDFAWPVIEPPLPTEHRVGGRRVLSGIFGQLRMGCRWHRARGRHDLRGSLQPVAQGRSLGTDIGGGIGGLRGRYPGGRLLVDPSASPCRQRQKRMADPVAWGARSADPSPFGRGCIRARALGKWNAPRWGRTGRRSVRTRRMALSLAYSVARTP